MHVTSASKRKFKPNLQRVKIIDDKGSVKIVWVSAKAIRSGLIKKAKLIHSLLSYLKKFYHLEF